MIVSQLFEVGGVETSIAGQVRSFIDLGWKVHLVCGKNHQKDILPSELTSFHPDYNFNPDCSFVELIKIVKSLSDLIKKEQISCVHAHPFISLIPAFLAAKNCNVKFLVTLHGPASLLSYYGNIYEYLLKGVILPNADLVVAVSEETKSLALPFCDENRLIVQRNVVDLKKFQPKNKKNVSKKWLVVSRLDSFKIKGIFEFIKLADQVSAISISIAGDGHAKVELQNQLQEAGLSEKVNFLGMRNDIPELMNEFEGVAGMGRVFIEAAACNKKVCLVGYDGVKGFLTEELFKKAAVSNFSGRNLSNLTQDEFKQQMNSASDVDFKKINKILEQQFDEASVWSKASQELLNLEQHPSGLGNELFRLLESSYQGNQENYIYSYLLLRDIGKIVHASNYYTPQISDTYYLYLNMYNHELVNNNLVNMIGALNNIVNEKDQTISRITNEKELFIAESNARYDSLLKEKENIYRGISDLNTKLLEVNNDNASVRAELNKVANEKSKIISEITLERENIIKQNGVLTASKNELSESLIQIKAELETIVREKDELINSLTGKNSVLEAEKQTLEENIQTTTLELERIIQEKNLLTESLTQENESVKAQLEIFKASAAQHENRSLELDRIVLEKESVIENISGQNSVLLDEKNQQAMELLKLKEEFKFETENHKQVSEEKERNIQELINERNSLSTENDTLKTNLADTDQRNKLAIAELQRQLEIDENIIQEITNRLTGLYNHVASESQQQQVTLSFEEKINVLERHIKQLETHLGLIRKKKLFTLFKLFDKEIE